MAVLDLGLVVGLLVGTVLVLRVLWLRSIREYLDDAMEGLETLLNPQLRLQVQHNIVTAWFRLTQGKLKQCYDLVLPILAIPVLILLYFVSAVVFLFWVFMPFLLLVSLIP